MMMLAPEPVNCKSEMGDDSNDIIEEVVPEASPHGSPENPSSPTELHEEIGSEELDPAEASVHFDNLEEESWAMEKTPDGAAHKQALLSALVEMFGTDEDGLTLLPGVVEIFSRCDGMNEDNPQYPELLKRVAGVQPDQAMAFMGSVWHISGLEYLHEMIASEGS